MRDYAIIGLIALLTRTAGHSLSANQESTFPPSQSIHDPILAKMLVGIWQFPWPDDRGSTRLELRADGSYDWWTPYVQSDLAAKSMLQTGKWLITGRTLTLRVEKTFLGHVPPNTAWTFDIVSVSGEKLLLKSQQEKRESTLIRTAKKDEPFWKSAVQYQPPFKMHSRLEPPRADTPVGDWALDSWDDAGTNAHASVIFHLETLGNLLGPETPTKAPQTISDLKSLVEAKFPPNAGVSNSLIKIDDMQALMSLSPKNEDANGLPKWRLMVCLFLERQPDWQKSRICFITMTAERRETLDLLINSLQNLKLLIKKQEKIGGAATNISGNTATQTALIQLSNLAGRISEQVSR
jgi:hypothetical protein